MMTSTTDPATVGATVAALCRDELFDDLEELFAPNLRAAVSAETVRVAWSSEIATIGAVRELGEPRTEAIAGGLIRVSIPVRCEHGGMTLVVAVDDTGALQGFRLAPPADAWTPPPYASERKLTEHEITLGPAESEVPAILTLPRGRGPCPAVVLVSSGPVDRDLTVGPNKPFKDLAWGLATRGVAVLRYDKSTRVHPESVTRPGFTMVDEYLPNAVAAVRFLRQHERVDAARVFLAGHSGGGKAVPRVAAAEPAVAGLVIMAGDTVSMPYSAIRTARYLAGPDPDPVTRAAADAFIRQAEATDSPGLTADTPASELLFGWPASYWLDLRAYDQVKTTVSLNKPILVLQGARDYQVTLAEDLPGWQTALADHPKAAFRTYAADDHMFFPGTGPSAPAQYEEPNHVDPAVITDIADWVGADRRGPLAALRKVFGR
ncbi:hypothetical protein ACIP5Y_45500 [Nocardia sp. NPDC088792]|uniref:alpha/beta hydrolase n=1 Tax=Nocardia sp. NPDC088792 TaxID=3364332 RepID=UPI00382DF22D